jgi:hypothetical protein
MRRTLRFRPAAAVLAALVLVFLVPGLAAATMTGPCTATGTSTSGSVNLNTATDWHMDSTDVAGGSGRSDVLMTEGSVAAYGLGIAIPIAGGSGNGDFEGSVDGVQVSTYAILGHRFTVKGEAHGEATCTGTITVILDDVDPLFTVFGGGMLILFAIALVAMVIVSRGGAGCLGKIFTTGCGLIGGAAVALASEQWGLTDPTDIVIGLAALIVGALIGFIVPSIWPSDDAVAGA